MSGVDLKDSARPQLSALTSLRFFAAMAVVVFHVADRYGDIVPNGVLKNLAMSGYAAVTFFFVLSGFILTYVHAGPTEAGGPDIATGTFWQRRAARIVPAYFLSLVLALPILIAFMQSSSSWERIVGPILVILFLQSWWPGLAYTWNYPAWSLSVEAFFYALYPWLSRKTAAVSRRWLFVGAYALVLTITAYYAMVADPLPGYVPLLNLPLFLFGMVLGRQFVFGVRLSSGWHVAMFIAGVVATALLFGFSSSLPSWTRSHAVIVLVFALIIFGAARPVGPVRVFTSGALVLLGEASYSIYLLHVPLRMWWDALAPDMPIWLVVLLYMSIVVGTSILVFRCVETPLRRWLSGLGRSGSRGGWDLSRLGRGVQIKVVPAQIAEGKARGGIRFMIPNG